LIEAPELTPGHRVSRDRARRVVLPRHRIPRGRTAGAKYAPSTASLRAYADRHGYGFHDLNPRNYTSCKRRQFFFAKHCAVAEFLRARPPGFAAVVLDGDTYAVAPAIPLDKWLADGADVVLYEREWTFECRRRGNRLGARRAPRRDMAGIYIVRHTTHGLAFLRHWFRYEDDFRRVKGYSGWDQGVIHLAVLDVGGGARFPLDARRGPERRSWASRTPRPCATRSATPSGSHRDEEIS